MTKKKWEKELRNRRRRSRKAEERFSREMLADPQVKQMLDALPPMEDLTVKSMSPLRALIAARLGLTAV
jgi:hypothetical protein